MPRHQIHLPAKRELIKDCLSRFPGLSNHALSRKVYNENRAMWPNLDAARSSVRYVRGNIGDRNRKQGNKAFHRPNGGPITLPESKAEIWPPFHLESKRTLLLSDIHVPYHDLKALTAALDYGRNYKPTTILLNGDGIDFHAISRYETDPRKRDLKDEIVQFKQFLGYLRQEFPKSRIVWKLGNHEERYEAFLIRKAPELLDIAVFGLDSLFECERLRIEVVKDQRMIMLGKLPVLHGHELPKGMSSPVNPARGFFMRGMESMIAGHLHRTSEHTEPTMMGRSVTCWSTACLCGMHPEYARINKWNQGFATVDCEGDGSFNVKNLRVLNGKIF